MGNRGHDNSPDEGTVVVVWRLHQGVRLGQRAESEGTYIEVSLICAVSGEHLIRGRNARKSVMVKNDGNARVLQLLQTAFLKEAVQYMTRYLHWKWTDQLENPALRIVLG